MNLILIPNTREDILAQMDAMPSDQRAQVSPVWLDWVIAPSRPTTPGPLATEDGEVWRWGTPPDAGR